MIKSYRDLRVYQQSYNLGKDIHQVTHQFPKHEQYELGSQLRRAAISIPLNIAEGYGKKQSVADFKRFLLIALGSCNEVQVLLDYAKDFSYISEEQYGLLWERADQLGKQLNKLHKNWQSL
ncbi:four helix bundle protein [Bacillus horti]